MADKVTSEQNKHSTNDYWDHFRSRALVLIAATQFVVIFVFLIICDVVGLLHFGWISIIVGTFIMSILLSGATIALFNLFSKPFHALIQAVMLTADESNAAQPNPHTHEYGEGFKDILQTVYELAAKNEEVPAPAEAEAPIDSAVVSGLNNTATGIVIMDSDRKIVYYNSHAPVHTDTEGSPVLDIVLPDDDSVNTWLDKVSENKVTAEHQWIRVSNHLPGEKDRRLYDLVASFHKNSKAETVLTFFDRTATYMPEEDDLDFISFAAHELRGPITVIRGYLDVLDDELKDVLHDDQAELMKRLIVTSNRLTSYINNILNASRYDRRHMKLHLTEETMRHIYDQVADDMQLRAQAQNRVLVVDIPESLPTVAADVNAVGEVIGNLIDNAIKYSNEGGLVHVTARAVPDFIEVSVIDRGIGMPSSVLPNLFHKFYRSHRSRETVAGTGIGLYICKAIVSSHGGTITARSVENEGSTFSFTLPIYDTVAQKLKAGNNSNVTLIGQGSGWIRNHSLYRG